MWRKSEVWKNRKFQVLLFVEILFLCIGIVGLLQGSRTISSLKTMDISLTGGLLREKTGEYFVDGSQGVSGEWLTASGFSLSPGVYEYRLAYSTDENAVNSVNLNAQAGFYGLLVNEAMLYSGIQQAAGQFYVTQHLGEKEGLCLYVNYYGTEPFTVKNIEIVKTNAGSRIWLCCVIVLSLLVNSLVMLSAYMGKYPVSGTQKLVWFGIPTLALLASLPVLVDYIIVGADFAFHMYRIEFLAKTLEQGIFPARVEGMWLYGHGYANSLFYCDTFLLVPALLRLIGFPMMAAYGMFVFVVNVATALIAYFSFKGMFQDKRIGMLGCMLYTLAPYRIYNIYNRSAVGEYTAMIFLPLVCYGFYLLFTRELNTKAYRSYWMVLVLGFTGIIQSHVLSCEIIALFAGILCILCIKKVFRKETFLQLVKAVVGTVLVNLWFLVPFLDMMSADKYRYSQNAGTHIQMRGILPAGIWYTTQNAGSNSRFHELGMIDTEPIGVGIAVLIGCVVFLYLRKVKRKENPTLARTGTVAFIVGATAVIASTCYFPWDSIQNSNSVAGTLVPMLQFPTRLTVVASVCLTVVACVAGMWMKPAARNEKLLFFGMITAGCIFFSLYQTNDILDENSGIMRIYTMEAAGHSGVLGAEYLPLGVDLPSQYHDAWPSEDVTVTYYEKTNLDTKTTLMVEDAGQQEYWVELPMLYYKGYRAEDMDTGELLPVCSGTNGHVRVVLENGYQGTVHTWYAGMWYWRVAEYVSLFSLLGIVAIVLLQRRNSKH